jgi:lipopolysaccharide/colanic/teichoic acid biosynthesis glycosyltransferase
MARPDYVNDIDGQPSISTWEEACAISQEWADSARRAAARKRLFMAVLSAVLLLLVALALVAVILITTDTVVL